MGRRKNIYNIHKLDARKIDTLIPNESIDVTITSPPYFDMKDYGHDEQIGYGQTYEQYLNDLAEVFSKTYQCTKNNGSLWVIIDTFIKDGAMVTLPFDFANKIKEVGWILREIIIWEKDKTVPWAHRGQMRNSFEYVLVFSKTKNFILNLDKVRDYETLKKWWIKYPERYNPKGKSPSSVWHFPIPTQGSWGDGYIRHFCPLPEELIAQIIALTTSEGDVVFDPFSGSGSVLSKAHNMKRFYIGTEINEAYISMFKDYVKKTHRRKLKEFEESKKLLTNQDDFETTIINLRALKYGRIIFQKIKDEHQCNILNMRVELAKQQPQKRNSLAVAIYSIFHKNISKSQMKSIEDLLIDITSKPPLSKFGIEPLFSFTQDWSKLIDESKPLYTYTKRVTHRYKKQLINVTNFELDADEIILSSLEVNIDERTFE